MLCQKIASLLTHWKAYRSFPYENYGGFRGVYSSFDEAIKDAPKTKSVGYNDPKLASWYESEFRPTLFDFDYPALFWLERLLEPGDVVLDFGGNVGTHYRNYQHYLSLIEQTTWQVIDLPEIVKVATSANSIPNLRFFSEVEKAENARIILASGSVQYIDGPNEFLRILKQRPEHILINRIPLYDGPQFVTLQNGGSVFYPQFVFNRSEFISQFETLEYELVDNWKEQTDRCFIPFRTRERVLVFDGFYFRRK